MIKYFITLLSVIIITSCGAEGQGTNANYENLQGIWGFVNEGGYFEFLDFINEIVVHGQIDFSGEVSFINIGMYHFHGPVAHLVWFYYMNDEGEINSTSEDTRFEGFITEDGNSIMVNFIYEDRNLNMNHLGMDPLAIDEAIGVPLLGEYTADNLIERLLDHLILGGI